MISDETAERLLPNLDFMRHVMDDLNGWADPEPEDFEGNILGNEANDRRWLVFMLAHVMDYAELLEWQLAKANQASSGYKTVGIHGLRPY